eukprot:g9726.t1
MGYFAGTLVLGFLHAATLEPAWAEAWNRLATVDYLLGNYNYSLKEIDKTLELQPRHFGALSGKGLVYLKLQRFQNAIDAFQDAQEVCPARNNLRWLTLPPDDRARNQAYQYWRLTSVPPRRSVNVWGIFWENAKSGISNSRPYSGFSTDTYCMSLLIFDESVGNTLACADWPLEKLLPSLSLQVKKKQPPPGSLVNMPFLCLGDIVLGAPSHFNSACDAHCFGQNEVPLQGPTCVMFKQPCCESDQENENGKDSGTDGWPMFVGGLLLQDWRPTLQHDTDAKMAQLYNFFRAKLEGETISRYLKTSVELNFEQPEDLVVEVLAIDAYKKDMLVTDWYGDPDTYILKGHWLKLRWVSKDPPADQDTEDSPDAGGDRPDCYVLASQVTRLPSWCHDVKVRRANSKLDRVADVVARFEEERGSNARLHLNEQRAARFWSEFYVDEGSLSPILEALRPQAPGDLLLGNFQVEGICGGPPYELSKTPQIEDLMGVRCRNCGSRYDFQTGMRWWRASRGRIETNAAADSFGVDSEVVDVQIDTLLGCIDTNLDGVVDYKEFVAWLTNRSAQYTVGTDGWISPFDLKTMLKPLFEMWDKDGSGHITRDEFYEIAQILSNSLRSLFQFISARLHPLAKGDSLVVDFEVKEFVSLDEFVGWQVGVLQRSGVPNNKVPDLVNTLVDALKCIFEIEQLESKGTSSEKLYGALSNRIEVVAKTTRQLYAPKLSDVEPEHQAQLIKEASASRWRKACGLSVLKWPKTPKALNHLQI